MSNLTITLDKNLLRRARIRALQEGTSVNALLRKKLEEYAGEPQEPAHITATREFLALAEATQGNSQGQRWSREELNER